MITAAQMRAARALAGIDQKELADKSGLSVPTIQRMEASEGVIRGNVDSLMKLIGALDTAGGRAGAGGGARGGRGWRLPASSSWLRMFLPGWGPRPLRLGRGGGRRLPRRRYPTRRSTS